MQGKRRANFGVPGPSTVHTLGQSIARTTTKMGKKSRRQKQKEPNELGERWDADAALRYKNGFPLGDYDLQELRETKFEARDTVDARCGYPIGSNNITHDWLDEYQWAVALPRIQTKGVDSAIRALKRWPRLQPYWPRLRRRVCDHCHTL